MSHADLTAWAEQVIVEMGISLDELPMDDTGDTKRELWRLYEILGGVLDCKIGEPE